MTDELAERIAAALEEYSGPEHAGLRALIAELVTGLERRDALVGTLTLRLEHLEGAVSSLQRAGKRQAAPFSKGAPKANPKKPGRKGGDDYGAKGHRAVPAKAPDRELAAPLPEHCPDCGGRLKQTGEGTQFLEDITIETVITKVVVARGRCTCCHKAVQGRHPEQVSDALGAAGSHLGPVVQALIAILAKECGLSHGKVSRVLHQLGLSITTGAVSGVLARLAARADPTYEALKAAVNAAPAVTPDETGWKIGGWPGWLWVFATSLVTVYSIDDARSFDAATKVLRPDYDGVIVRDGWAPYRRYAKATHQSCVAHLLRRACGLIEAKARGWSTVPVMLRDLLCDALALRDRRDAGEVVGDAYATQMASLEQRVDSLLARRGHTEENRRLLKHLRTEKEALLTFLRHEGVDATNWRAEQGVRPGVVNRKVWGGSRTDTGARTHERLVSLLRTAAQQGEDALAILGDLIRSPLPKVAPLAGLVPQGP
ncbi:MAG: IS66 family transposase [Acidimicrobiales bacterium]